MEEKIEEAIQTIISTYSNQIINNEYSLGYEAGLLDLAEAVRKVIHSYGEIDDGWQ